MDDLGRVRPTSRRRTADPDQHCLVLGAYATLALTGSSDLHADLIRFTERTDQWSSTSTEDAPS